MKTSRLKQFLYCFLWILCSRTSSAQGVSCPPNIDFEFGNFQNWQCYTGFAALSGGNNVITVNPSPPSTTRHTIISSPGGLDLYGNFPTLCPNGSGYSIKLGNNASNRHAERVSYSFTIPAGQNEYSIIYQYAVVFQDPNHTLAEQPRFTAKVYDVSSGNYVSCATFQFVATSNIPGFRRSHIASNVWYKPWTPVTINLSGYAGRTVILEFTTSDCTQGGHFGYAYVDVNVGCTSPVRGATYCPDAGSVTLNAPFGYQSYSWFTSDMSQHLGSQPTLTLSPAPPVNTSFALDIVPFPGFGCRDTVFATVKPGMAPVATAGADKFTCRGGTVSIGVPPQPGLSYSWTPATDLSNPSIANPLASPQESTRYILKVTDNLTGCSKNDTVMVNITAPASPFFEVINGPAQCVTGNNFQFGNYNPANLNYTWKFGDGSVSSQHSPSHHYSQPGSYPVTMILSGPDGCTDSATQTVRVHPLPAGWVSAASTNICEGTPVTLTAYGGLNYTWYKDGLPLNNHDSNSFNALHPGNYTVDLTDSNGCKNSARNTVTLELIKRPMADFSFDKYCIDLPVSFSNRSQLYNSGPADFNWNFGNGMTMDKQDPVISFSNTGNYAVSLSVTPKSCPQLASTVQKTLSIEKAIPGISYAPVNAVADQPLNLKARSIGNFYLWLPAVHLNNAFNSQPVYRGNSEQIYRIQITNPSGCITVDTQLVRIFREREIFVPTAFTPNGDGQNDRIFPFLVGIKELRVFRIINRWGVVVFNAKTDLPGWDGYYQGKPQPMEGYVWEAIGVDMDGKTISKKGAFTLIR